MRPISYLEVMRIKSFGPNRTVGMTMGVVMVLLTAGLLTGCLHMRSTTFISPQNLRLDSHAYPIVHHTITKATYHLDGLTVNADGGVISGEAQPLGPGHQTYRKANSRYGNIYKFNAFKEKPLDEVHFYVDAWSLKDGGLSFSTADIQRVDVYDLAVGRVIASYTSAALVTAGVVYLIILALKSSCPFVYTMDGDVATFRGEMFGGAIAPNLARHDFMPLPGFEPEDDAYTLKITNELQEIQFTDVAQLAAVTHDREDLILMDQDGHPFVLSNPLPPVHATTDLGTDVRSELKDLDQRWFQFLDEMEGQPAYASLDMTFEADRPTSQAKLMLDLKNTMWMDHSFERFCASFGDKYEAFARRQKRRAAEEKEQWMDDEGMTLAVKVKRHGNWELVDRINMVGPLASRSVVVPIPGQVQPGEQLRIRLECGYHFWEVDQAAMDFSVDGPVIVDNLPLLEAHDESGRDVRASLLDLDGDVMSQLFTGAEATLRFDATSLDPRPHEDVTVFLHTHGHYEYVRDYSGKPNLAELKSFRAPGTFAAWSKARLESHMAIHP